MNTPEERRVAYLASGAHFFTHGFMTLLPALLVIITGIEGMSFFTIGLIGNIGYFLYGLGSIPAGMLTDRYGPKRMLTIGVGGMAVASILVGLSRAGWFFAATYGIFGLFASIYHPAGLSLIARHIEKKGRALGLHGVFGNLGLSLAPLFAGGMAYLFNTWRAAFLSFGLLGLLYVMVLHRSRITGENELSVKDVLDVLKGRRPSLRKKKTGHKEKETVISVPLLLLYVGAVLFGYMYRGTLTFFPTLFQQEINYISTRYPPEPTLLAGLLTSGIIGCGMAGLWLAGRVLDRVREPVWIQIVVFIFSAPVLYMIGSSSELPLVVYSAIYSLVFFGWQPVQNALVARYTSRRSHGRGYGVNFFLIMGVGSIVTSIGGYLTDRFGAYMVYNMLSLVSLAGVMIYFSVLRLRGYTVKLRYSIQREGGTE
ncbi:MAG: MFS transporter [Nitrospirae bacterium]|nr:MAG: MFS transporter [Nitrospirota bacterium]